MKINIEIDFNKQPEELNNLQYIVLCLVVAEKDVVAELVSENSDFSMYQPAKILDIVEDLEDMLYIKTSWDDDLCTIELRKKATDLFPENKGASFDEFWDKYHELSKKPKTDREAAFKYWKRLKSKEQQLALDNIENYITFVARSQGMKFIKKARTYLADKNFYDEFEANDDDVWTKNHV